MASVDLTGADRFSVRGWEFEQWVGSICPTKSNFRFARDKIWICRWLWQALQLHHKQIILIELRQNCKGVLDKGHIDICNKATNRKTTVNETFLLWHFSWDQQRAITLMNLVPANQFGSHFLNHKNRNWKHMHQTKWYKLQNISCQKLRTFLFSEKYDKKLKANGPSLLSGVHVTSLTEPQNGFMEFQQICSYYQDLNIHNAGRMFTLLDEFMSETRPSVMEVSA